MDDRLHWVMGEDDDRAACGVRAEGRVRSTELDKEYDHEVCATCLTLWTRYALRVEA